MTHARGRRSTRLTFTVHVPRDVGLEVQRLAEERHISVSACAAALIAEALRDPLEHEHGALLEAVVERTIRHCLWTHVERLGDLAARAAAVDAEVIAPYLGYYEKGWRLAFDADGALRLRQSSRAIRLLAMPDGSYVMAGGVVPGTAVRFSRDEGGTPWLEIQDYETVRWTTGPA